LLAERNKRIRPAVDDKILTSWNALMLKAYTDAYVAFGHESYLKKALIGASFLEKNMLNSEGHLWRNYRNGKTSLMHFLMIMHCSQKHISDCTRLPLNKHWLSLAGKITEYAY
jgi:uncharacterized protein YyaL (SSP411 family)